VAIAHHVTESSSMPHIEIHAQQGTFADLRKLAIQTSALMREIERLPDIPMVRQNIATIIHEINPSAFVALDGHANCVKVQVQTNEGALDREQQLELVRRMTDLMTTSAAIAGNNPRIWVVLSEATPGGWGMWGYAHTNADLAVAVKAEIAILHGTAP
jgi:phenylpyruvate tautomerase PptA (4-oxalocrotonate tautomerase family)